MGAEDAVGVTLTRRRNVSPRWRLPPSTPPAIGRAHSFQEHARSAGRECPQQRLRPTSRGPVAVTMVGGDARIDGGLNMSPTIGVPRRACA